MWSRCLFDGEHRPPLLHGDPEPVTGLPEEVVVADTQQFVVDVEDIKEVVVATPVTGAVDEALLDFDGIDGLHRRRSNGGQHPVRQRDRRGRRDVAGLRSPAPFSRRSRKTPRGRRPGTRPTPLAAT